MEEVLERRNIWAVARSVLASFSQAYRENLEGKVKQNFNLRSQDLTWVAWAEENEDGASELIVCSVAHHGTLRSL